MRKYDHLFFDLDDTLWDFQTNSRQAMKETLADLNIITDNFSFNQFFEYYEEINKGLWSLYHQKKISKENLIRERFARSLDAFNITGWLPEAVNKVYLENMGRQTNLFPGTIDTLTALQNKGYVMHIITNGFKEVQYEKLRNCQIDQFFDKVFISEEIQSAKPHREIFEYAIKSANAKKSKSIMIGDSWETDMIGVQRFGIDGIWVSNNKPFDHFEMIKMKKNEQKGFFLIQSGKTTTYFIPKVQQLLSIL